MSEPQIAIRKTSASGLRRATETLNIGDYLILVDNDRQIVGKVRKTNGHDDLRTPYICRPHETNRLFSLAPEMRPRRVKFKMSDFGDLKKEIADLLAKCRLEEQDLTIHVTLHDKPCLTITAH